MEDRSIDPGTPDMKKEMFHISDAQYEAFFQSIGRRMNTRYISPQVVKFVLRREHFVILQAKRYERDVWSKRNRDAFIASQAAKCADFAKALCLGEKALIRNYLLEDAGGRPSFAIGNVHFRVTEDYCLTRLGVTPQHRDDVITIEAIRLHPSLRRRQFLSTLMKELKVRGFKFLVLAHVANPSLAYSLYQKTLTSNKVVLLSDSNTVAFDTQVSPLPTFAWNLAGTA